MNVAQSRNAFLEKLPRIGGVFWVEHRGGRVGMLYDVGYVLMSIGYDLLLNRLFKTRATKTMKLIMGDNHGDSLLICFLVWHSPSKFKFQKMGNRDKESLSYYCLRTRHECLF